jgi:hypothetical protein
MEVPPDLAQESCKVGRNVILSAAKNLRVIAEVLACQRDSSLRSEPVNLSAKQENFLAARGFNSTYAR